MSYPSDGQSPRAYPGDGAPRDFQQRRPPQGYQPRGGYPPPAGPPPQGYQGGGRAPGYDDYAPGSYQDPRAGGPGRPGGAYQGRGGYTDQGNYGAQGGYAVNDGYGGQSQGGYGSGGGYGPQGGGWSEREPATQVIDAYPGGLPGDDDDDTGGGKRRLKTKKDKKARRRKIRKILLICLAVFVLLIAGGTFAGWQYINSVEDKVTKVDAFDAAQLPEAERPVKEPTKAMNILVLGSDSRDPDTTGSRADTIMVAHVTADQKTAQIISIPRDSWVDIPKSADGKHGGVKGKINWSYSWGGIPLMIRSVEALAKVRIDHVIVIDFAGFKQVVDAVGGIDINNDVRFTNYFNPNYVFEKGKIHLSGDLALEYARNRKTLPDGDFGRMRHQQMVVKAVLDKATSAGTIADPSKLTKFLNAIAKTITTDKSFNLIGTATDLRGIGSKSIRFMTTPTKGTGRVGDQSVVFVDTNGAASLFAALRADKAASWTAGS